MGVSPDQFREMEERVSKNRRVPLPPPAAPPPAQRSEDDEADRPLVKRRRGFQTKCFTYRGRPIGKPRMTQRDKWQKRPCVVEYREFADNLRLAAGELPALPDGLIVTAYMPMPESWSLKKKAKMQGTPCRTKPDYDNIAKAVADALFEEDSCIWFGATMKYWCQQGAESLYVEVLYAESQ